MAYLLLDYFFEQAAENLGKSKPPYPHELSLLLSTFSFAGNIRELQSMVFDALSQRQSRTFSMDGFKNYIGRNCASCIRPLGDILGRNHSVQLSAAVANAERSRAPVGQGGLAQGPGKSDHSCQDGWRHPSVS